MRFNFDLSAAAIALWQMRRLFGNAFKRKTCQPMKGSSNSLKTRLFAGFKPPCRPVVRAG
jgi:hypothetical protein